MTITHLQDLEKRLAGRGWTVAECTEADSEFSARWKLSRHGGQSLTLNFEGLDDADILPIKRSYACHVDGRPGASLHFSKDNRREWQQNLAAFMLALDAAADESVDQALNRLSILPTDAQPGFDWGIDGVPLAEWMSTWTKKPPAAGVPTWDDDDVRQLAGRAVRDQSRLLPSGRIPLYICPECGDLGCGCFAVRVGFYPDVVTWGDFTHENNYERPSCEPDPDYTSVPVLKFDKAAYLSTLTQHLISLPG